MAQSKLVTKRRRLFIDIETSANVGYFWQSGYKLNIGPENIIKERAIICICYKWEDEREVHYFTWDSRQSDKRMLEAFMKVAKDAVEIIAHNSDRFDVPWIRTRCLFHDIPMFPQVITLDTLKVARSKFKFNSNKLNYIAQFLGIGSKIKTDYSLWKDIMFKNDKVAMAKMVKYCQKDVILLEKVFKRLRPHIDPKTHYGVIFGEDRGSCPECGSEEIIRWGTRVTVSGLVKVRYSCKVCGTFHSQTEKKAAKKR